MAHSTTTEHPPSPYHVLMANARPPSAMTSHHDYVAKRYYALLTGPPAEDDHVWLGVSPLERSLVECCEPISSVDTHVTRGALDKSRVLPFLRLTALHCQNASARSLALAILERSRQEDELDEQETPEEPPMKRSRVSASAPTANEDAETLPSADNKDSRVASYLAAGGLRILQQWLVDASTPVVGNLPPKPPPGVRPIMRPPPPKTETPPTGPLLLPLLQFLRDMPFDRTLVTKSKIHKQIKKLSKGIEGLLADAKRDKNLTHAVTGGLPVMQVYDALEQLKRVWEEKAKSGEQLQAIKSPFESIQAALEERHQELVQFNDGKGEKPDWLARAEQAEKDREEKRARKGLSTEQLARRERENERAAMERERAALMKEDLQKAQETRRQLVKKLRELKFKSDFAMQRPVRASRSKRTVRWKDGLGVSSKLKKKDLLEEIFLIPSRARQAMEGLLKLEDDETTVAEADALDADDRLDDDVVDL